MKAKGTLIQEEQKVIEQMICLYCRQKEGNETLCAQCEALRQYALARLEHCPFGEKKTTCKQCPIHCYRSDMREQMKSVMRYAGPRMLWHHPKAALWHLWREFNVQQKRKNSVD